MLQRHAAADWLRLRGDRDVKGGLKAWLDNVVRVRQGRVRGEPFLWLCLPHNTLFYFSLPPHLFPTDDLFIRGKKRRFPGRDSDVYDLLRKGTAITLHCALIQI